MKVEINIFLLAVIAILPVLLVYITLKTRFSIYNKEIKRLENEALTLHSTILELEGEIVRIKDTYQIGSDVVKMNENKTKAI